MITRLRKGLDPARKTASQLAKANRWPVLVRHIVDKIIAAKLECHVTPRWQPVGWLPPSADRGIQDEPGEGSFRILYRPGRNLELRLLHRRDRQSDAPPHLHHHIYELFAAIVVNLIATILKFGDRTQIGAVHLSTSLVADLQLVAAACVWAIAVHVSGDGMSAEVTTSVVSLSGGALFANVVSVILLIVETVMLRR